jgi:hypothetical protein
MNMKNVVAMVVTVGLLFSACLKNVDNGAFISILSPYHFSVINNADKTDFLIAFSTNGGDLYDVRVKAYPKNNVNDKVFDREVRPDVSLYLFVEEVDLSRFPPGTGFIIVAEADRDPRGKSRIIETAEFSIR